MTHVTIAYERQVGFAGNDSFLARALSLVAAWGRRIKQRRELGGLLYQSDYILKDMGLQRHEITQEALKPFWKD